jgi:cytochrome c5
MGLAVFRVAVVLVPLVLWIFSIGPREGIAVASERSMGRDVFLQNCAACHVNGVAQAPRIGSLSEWEPRLASGRQSMLNSVLRGKGGMPPKGGNASITDAQAVAALDYIVSRVLELEHEAEAAMRPRPGGSAGMNQEPMKEPAADKRTRRALADSTNDRR